MGLEASLVIAGQTEPIIRIEFLIRNSFAAGTINFSDCSSFKSGLGSFRGNVSGDSNLAPAIQTRPANGGAEKAAFVDVESASAAFSAVNLPGVTSAGLSTGDVSVAAAMVRTVVSAIIPCHILTSMDMVYRDKKTFKNIIKTKNVKRF